MGYVELGDTFDQMRVQRLRHQLVGHPLMSAQSIADLALRIDPDFVRFHDGDRSVISERALETFYRVGKLRDAIYQPDVEPKAQVFELQPGDCIYMPMGSPHAAVTGDDITATFSLLMNTRSSYDLVETYRVN